MTNATRRALRTACLPALLLALAGCGNDDRAQMGKTAQGEILPGSVSDAMLPLDSLRSQPPLAPRSDPSGRPGTKGDGAGDAPDTAPDRAVEAPAPPPDPEPLAGSEN